MSTGKERLAERFETIEADLWERLIGIERDQADVSAEMRRLWGRALELKGQRVETMEDLQRMEDIQRLCFARGYGTNDDALLFKAAEFINDFEARTIALMILYGFDPESVATDFDISEEEVRRCVESALDKLARCPDPTVGEVIRQRISAMDRGGRVTGTVTGRLAERLETIARELREHLLSIDRELFEICEKMHDLSDRTVELKKQQVETKEDLQRLRSARGLDMKDEALLFESDVCLSELEVHVLALIIRQNIDPVDAATDLGISEDEIRSSLASALDKLDRCPDQGLGEIVRRRLVALGPPE